MKFKLKRQYRLKGYDYSRSGAYSITIVTKNREHFFGEIVDKKMILSPIGIFVEQNFIQIKESIKYLAVTEHTLMPDHLHLIVVIKRQENIPVQSYPLSGPGLRPLQEKSVSSFINHLKGKIKRWCNENGHDNFRWQDKFHDRIIRNAREYERISWYIRNNVWNWEKPKS